MTAPSRYSGMTVNERLFDAGLLAMFDAAVSTQDRAELIRLLTEVDVYDAAWSVETILRRSERCGL